MGTNYYLVTKEPVEMTCDHCGSTYLAREKKHIGKNSVGWVFALHVYPEQGINCWRDWDFYIRTNAGAFVIEDEYGDEVPLYALRELVNAPANGRRIACVDDVHVVGLGGLPYTTHVHMVGEFS